MGPTGGTTTPDPIMRELFVAEVDMHLPVLSEGLLALEKGRAGKKEIESLMRAAHSIKGAARIVGIDPAVRIAHALEDCFTAAKEERILLQSDAVDVLLQGVDALQRTCASAPDPDMNEEFIQSLLRRITSVRDGKTAPPPPPVNSSVAPPVISAAAPLVLPHLPQDTLIFPAVFDSSAAESLRGRFCEILEHPPASIHIEFGQVEHLGVAALSLLLSFAGQVRELQPVPGMEAHRVTPAVRALFRVVGLDSAFSLSD